MAFNKGLQIVDAGTPSRKSISLDNLTHGLFQSHKTTATADSANGSVVFTIRPAAKSATNDTDYQEIIKGQNLVIGIEYNKAPSLNPGTEFRLVVQNRVDYDNGVKGATDAVYGSFVPVDTETTFGLTFQQNGTMTLMQTGGVLTTHDITSWTPKTAIVELEEVNSIAAGNVGHIILDDLKGNQVELKTAPLDPGAAGAAPTANSLITALKNAFDAIDHRAEPNGTDTNTAHGFLVTNATPSKLKITREDGSDFKVLAGADNTQGILTNATTATQKLPTAFFKIADAQNGKDVKLTFAEEGAGAVAANTTGVVGTTGALAATEIAATIDALAGFTAIVDPVYADVVKVTNTNNKAFTVAVDNSSNYTAGAVKVSDSTPAATTALESSGGSFLVSDITTAGLTTSDSDLLSTDFDGFISQVAEFETVLTATQLASYVNQPATIPTPVVNSNANVSSAVIGLTGDLAQDGKIYEIVLNADQANEFKFKFTDESGGSDLETGVLTGLKAAFDTEAAEPAGARGFKIDASITGQLKVTRDDGADFTVSNGSTSSFVATGDFGQLQVNGEAVGANTTSQVFVKIATPENTTKYNFELKSGGQSIAIQFTSGGGATKEEIVDGLIAALAKTPTYTGTKIGTDVLKITSTHNEAFTIDADAASSTDATGFPVFGVATAAIAGYTPANVTFSADGKTFAAENALANPVSSSQLIGNTTVHSSELEAAKGVLTFSASDLSNIVGKTSEFVLDSGAGQVATVNTFIPQSTADIPAAIALIKAQLDALDNGSDGDLDVDQNGDGDNTDLVDETGFDFNNQSVAYIKFGTLVDAKKYNFKLTGPAVGSTDQLEYTNENAKDDATGDAAVLGLMASGDDTKGYTLSAVGDGTVLKIVREDGAAFKVSAGDHATPSTYADDASVQGSADGVTFANLLEGSTATSNPLVAGAQIVFDRDDGQNFTIKLGTNDEAGKLKFDTEGGPSALTTLTKDATVSTTNGADKSATSTVSNGVVQNFDFTTITTAASSVTSGGVVEYTGKGTVDILGLSKRDGATLVKLASPTVGMDGATSVGFTGAAVVSNGGVAADVLYGQLRDVGKVGANREMTVDLYVDPALIADGNLQSLSYTLDFGSQNLTLQSYTHTDPVSGYELVDTTAAGKVTGAWFQPGALTDFTKPIATMNFKNTGSGNTDPTLKFTAVDIDGTDFTDGSTYAATFSTSMLANLIDVGDQLLNGVDNTTKAAGELVAVEASTGSALTPTPASGLYLDLKDWSNTASAASPNVQFDMNLKTATTTNVIKFKIKLPANADTAATTFTLDPALNGWTLTKNVVEGRSLVVEGTGTQLATGSTLGTVSSTVTNAHGKAQLFELADVQTDTDAAFESGRDLYVATATTNAEGKWSVNDLPVGIMSRYYEGAATKAANAVTAVDALHALQISAGQVPSWSGLAASTDGMIKAADYDGSGKVTAADALAILQASVALDPDPRTEWFFFDSLTTGVLGNDVNKNIKALQANVAISTDNLSMGLGDKVVLVGDLTDPSIG